MHIIVQLMNDRIYPYKQFWCCMHTQNPMGSYLKSYVVSAMIAINVIREKNLWLVVGQICKYYELLDSFFKKCALLIINLVELSSDLIAEPLQRL